jgi:Flp pilus assembly protein TadD
MNNTLGKASGKCRLGLCFAAMLGFAGSGYAAGDAVEAGKFELTIVQETVGGNDIVAGEFSAAVEKINTALSLDSKYAKSTNLCAAYTAQGEFAGAQPHCKAALSFSRSSRYGLLGMSRSYTSKRSMQAMALNNLGVWHALQGDADQARAYFKNAASRSKDLVATSSRNIDVLKLRVGPATVAAS